MGRAGVATVQTQQLPVRPFVKSQRWWWLPECLCLFPESGYTLSPLCVFIRVDGPSPLLPTAPSGACVMSWQVWRKPAQTGFTRPLVFTPCETLMTRVFV